jgi:nucleoside-diphosphate-sugar epimerase
LKALERAGATPLVLDLFDREAVRRSIAGFDAIVNLATHIPPPGLKLFFRSAWKETDRIREHGSALLVEEALSSGARLFVQESFAPIYEDSGDRWITEETRQRAAPYNEATLKAEASADRFSKGGGRGVVLRFAYFYGPGDRFTLETFKSVRRGWLPIFGRPDGFFPTVNHEDAALAVVAALDAPSGIYNVVDNEPLTRRQLGDALSEMLSVPPPRVPPAWLTRLTGSVGTTMARSLRISNAKLRDTTGWTPRYATEREGWRAAFQGEQPSSVGG